MKTPSTIVPTIEEAKIQELGEELNAANHKLEMCCGLLGIPDASVLCETVAVMRDNLNASQKELGALRKADGTLEQAYHSEVQKLKGELGRTKEFLGNANRESTDYKHAYENEYRMHMDTKADRDAAQSDFQNESEAHKRTAKRLVEAKHELDSANKKLNDWGIVGDLDAVIKQRDAVQAAWHQLKEASIKFTDEVWAHIPEEQWRNPPVHEALKRLQDARKVGDDCGKDYVPRSEVDDTKRLLAEKNETANVFMNQVRKLQKQNQELTDSGKQLVEALKIAHPTMFDGASENERRIVEKALDAARKAGIDVNQCDVSRCEQALISLSNPKKAGVE